MGAVDEIRAAIETLEALAHSASDGPWVAYVERTSNEITAELFDDNGGYVISDGYVADVELIVTLHRTIDAQLAILHANIGAAQDVDANATPDEPAALGYALILARAIAGDVS